MEALMRLFNLVARLAKRRRAFWAVHALSVGLLALRFFCAVKFHQRLGLVTRSIQYAVMVRPARASSRDERGRRPSS